MKKVIKKVKEVEAPIVETVKTEIGHFTGSFGQEDLNKMVEKLNELIDKVNSCYN